MERVYQNPIVLNRADPFIYKHTDGFYYFTASVPEYDRIEIRRAKTIQGLGQIEGKTIWEKHQYGEMSELVWAPEIHFLNGKWYVYFAAAPNKEITGNTFNHRMYVIENESADPLVGKWIERGQIKTGLESFSLDATVMEHKGDIYYIWAQDDKEISKESHSNIYIARMENPWTLSSRPVLLTFPEFEWERKDFWVNEGPGILKKNGKIFLTYSASATNENYCVGMLVASEDSDLLNPDAWEKLSKPVFKTSYENEQYGPGHNSFTVSEDGKEDVLVYHARNYREIQGDALYDPNRHSRAQIIHWQADGMPDFGTPERDANSLNKERV